MIKIQDIATLSNGINFGKSAYTSGIKLIGVSDFKDRMYPDYNSLQEVDAKIVRENDFLHKGDIVFVRSNGNKELVGRCMMINQDIPVTFSGFCIRLRLNNTQLYNPTFFTYLFKSNGFRKAIAGTAVGANIQNLSQGRLGNYEFECPNIETQNRIATTLSRYDSLIDNYQKQIKLLEEAAQRLYKEWFVNLRFPGHESTKIVDGVPEGWEKKRLSDIGNVITGKTPSTSHKEYYGGTIPFITIPDMHGLFPENSQYLTDVGANMQAKKFIPKGSIIVSCIGTAGLVCIAKEICQTNQQINSLILNDIELLGYMYFTLCGLKGHLNNIGSNGATMTNVSKSKFESIETTIPTTRLYKEFNDICSTIFNTIKSLSTQLRLLTESRDRLLPKLLSGEIEV